MGVSTHLPTLKNTTQGKWLPPEDFRAIAGVLLSGINGLTMEAGAASRFPVSRFPERLGVSISRAS
jgi:hypothetical protein